MTTASSAALRPASRQFHNWYIATLLFSLAVPLIVAYVTTLISAVFLLGVAPVVLAAYSRRGMTAVLAVILFLVSAMIPAALNAWGKPDFPATITGLVTYSLMLGLFGFLATNLAHSVRNRRILAGAHVPQLHHHRQRGARWGSLCNSLAVHRRQ